MIKVDNIIANKLTGIYSNIWAIDPYYIEDNFWAISLSKDLREDYGILKRYLKKLLAAGRITVIDMSKPSPERTKIRAAFKNEPGQEIEFEGKHITTEL